MKRLREELRQAATPEIGTGQASTARRSTSCPMPRTRRLRSAYIHSPTKAPMTPSAIYAPSLIRTELLFPGTELRLVYELVSSHNR